MTQQTDDSTIIESKADLLRRIEQGWNALQGYLGTLTEEQLTQPTDDAGWTAKDHVIHLAVWEDGIFALLEGKSRPEAMGVDQVTWEGSDTDTVNAVIQQRYHDMPLNGVLGSFRLSHDRLVQKVESMTDEDLQRPYRYYAPDSDREQPVIGWIIGNTYEHYAEHQPWIEDIVARR